MCLDFYSSSGTHNIFHLFWEASSVRLLCDSAFLTFLYFWWKFEKVSGWYFQKKLQRYSLYFTPNIIYEPSNWTLKLTNSNENMFWLCFSRQEVFLFFILCFFFFQWRSDFILFYFNSIYFFNVWWNTVISK